MSLNQRIPEPTGSTKLLMKNLAANVDRELKEGIIPFWLRLMDDVNGGFFGLVDSKGRIDQFADKGVLLQLRILWFFSRAANYFGESSPLFQSCSKAAAHAFEFLQSTCWDAEKGGMYWLVSYQGQMVDGQKHLYAQAFALYAMSEYVKLTNRPAALQFCHDLFQLIEARHDDEHKGYFESFDRYWQAIPNALLCDTEESVVTPKTMNTHLHLLEAFSSFYEVSPSEPLSIRLRELLSILSNKMLNPMNQFDLYFGEDWTIRSSTNSFGHDIEGSWLMWEAGAKVVSSNERQEMKDITLAMVRQVIDLGLDEDFSLFNEVRQDRGIDKNRVWWAQAETLVGLVNAWELSCDNRYLQLASLNWTFIEQHQKSSTLGEWLPELDEKLKPVDGPLANTWKCPYHHGRAMIEVAERLDLNE